jgi:hypothetical protein
MKNPEFGKTEGRTADPSASLGMTSLLGDSKYRFQDELSSRLGLPAEAYSLTVTVFTSVYCCKPYSPSSRPIPDCLKPPNGARVSNTW